MRVAVLIGLALAVAACAPTVDQAAVTDAEFDDAAPRVHDVIASPADDIVDVRFEASGEIATLERRSGVWAATGATEPFAATSLRLSEDDIFPLLAYRAFDAAEDDSAYGFDTPQASLEVETAAGDLVRITLGDLSFTTAGFYARLDAAPERIYIVPRGAYVAAVSMLPSGVDLASPHLVTYEEMTDGGLQEALTDIDVDNPWLSQVVEHRTAEVRQ